MRLLFLAHRIPYPPNKGDKIRSFHMVDYLARRHEVDLGCLIDDVADLAHLPELEGRVRALVFQRIRPRMRKILALGALLGSRPITVDYFYSRALQRKIDALLDEGSFDAVVCFSSPMAEYVFRSRHAHGGLARSVRLMDLIDVDSRKWQQYADRGSALMAPIYRFETRHLADYERRIAARFDRVLVVSEQERAMFPAGGLGDNIVAVPNGVDLAFFRPDAVSPGTAERPTVVFTGMMDYWPNVDGVTWFADAVLPRVQARLPDVEFLIVGARPTRDVARLGDRRGVKVTGFVEDVRTYLSRAHVCVAPLRVARGIQNKVLEAMAMGKAVVSTPEAFEGIQAVAGEEIVVADGAEAFAAAVVDLLSDESRAREIGRRARARVESDYGWEAKLSVLDDLLTARRDHLAVPSGMRVEYGQDGPAVPQSKRRLSRVTH